MTILELRDHVVRELYGHMQIPVILSDQVMPEAAFPYITYNIVTPYARGSSVGEIKQAVPSDNPDFAHDVLSHRVEIASATFSFSACSQNRETESGYIYGENEAVSLAEKAHGWFLYVGKPILRALGIGVADVMNLSGRSEFEAEDTDRRWGFDVRLTYKRADVRRDAAVYNGKIIDNGPRSFTS